MENRAWLARHQNPQSTTESASWPKNVNSMQIIASCRCRLVPLSIILQKKYFLILCLEFDLIKGDNQVGKLFRNEELKQVGS